MLWRSTAPTLSGVGWRQGRRRTVGGRGPPPRQRRGFAAPGLGHGFSRLEAASPRRPAHGSPAGHSYAWRWLTAPRACGAEPTPAGGGGSPGSPRSRPSVLRGAAPSGLRGAAPQVSAEPPLRSPRSRGAAPRVSVELAPRVSPVQPRPGSPAAPEPGGAEARPGRRSIPRRPGRVRGSAPPTRVPRGTSSAQGHAAFAPTTGGAGGQKVRAAQRPNRQGVEGPAAGQSTRWSSISCTGISAPSRARSNKASPAAASPRRQAIQPFVSR